MTRTITLAIASVLLAGFCSGCGASPRPTASPHPLTSLQPIPTPALSPESARLLALVAFHLDVWDRQLPVLDAFFDQTGLSKTEIEHAKNMADIVSANGMTFRWEIANAWSDVQYKSSLDKRAVCWSAYEAILERLSNGMGSYGYQVRDALESGSDNDWEQARAIRANAGQFRLMLPDLEAASIACEFRSGPVPAHPSDPPLVGV
jgi:hypothetical protein